MKAAKFAVCLPLLALVACQTMPYEPYAREVKKKPGAGGTIALRTNHRDEDRQKAQTLMTNTCAGNTVKVVEEGEVVVGTETVSNTRQNHRAGSAGTQVGSLWGIPVTSGATAPGSDTTANATTTAVKEWNITYECGAAVAAETTAPAAVVPAKATTGKVKR